MCTLLRAVLYIDFQPARLVEFEYSNTTVHLQKIRNLETMHEDLLYFRCAHYELFAKRTRSTSR
eukprot:COSAG05_NODE_513_length_9084_cov_5.373957_13_plen_64_part_00